MSLTTPKRFTISEYYRLTELGFFQENDRVELIRGEIIEMAAKGIPHVTCCRNLIMELAVLISGQAKLQCQDPISLPTTNSEPEPDITIIKLRDDDYLSNHPQPKDILLVIEIADSTLRYDKEIKLPLYAEAGISHYWLFNLVANHWEAYSNPYQSSQGDFGYQLKQILLPDNSVDLPNLNRVTLDLSLVFPNGFNS